MNNKKEHAAALANLKMDAENYVEQQARKDMAFQDVTKTLQNMGATPEQVNRLNQALIHYARAGAGRAFQYLQNRWPKA
jgi:flagellar basal body P-ring protein FlgI